MPQNTSNVVQPSAHQSATTGMRPSASMLPRASSGDCSRFGKSSLHVPKYEASAASAAEHSSKPPSFQSIPRSTKIASIDTWPWTILQSMLRKLTAAASVYTPHTIDAGVCCSSESTSESGCTGSVTM